MDVREAYEKTVHCYRLSMRMLKLATYIVLSIGVLITALISKGALLLMTNSVAKVQEVIFDHFPSDGRQFLLDTLSRTLGVDVINNCFCSVYLHLLR